MEPSLFAGDRITIEGSDVGRLRRGDIVVYDSPQAGLIVHRLMWKVPLFGETRAVLTKGDALPFLDRPVAVPQLMGRVVEVERGGDDGTGRKLTGASAWSSWWREAVALGWRWGWGRLSRASSAR